jgi:hypothetical protein
MKRARCCTQQHWLGGQPAQTLAAGFRPAVACCMPFLLILRAGWCAMRRAKRRHPAHLRQPLLLCRHVVAEADGSNV